MHTSSASDAELSPRPPEAGEPAGPNRRADCWDSGMISSEGEDGKVPSWQLASLLPCVCGTAPTTLLRWLRNILTIL
jgi:hypothetical protein